MPINGLSYAPYGQGKSRGEDRSNLKKKWDLRNVPTFEVWAAATCYDPEKPHGGTLFQEMMSWCLTQGQIGTLETETNHFIIDKDTTDTTLPAHCGNRKQVETDVSYKSSKAGTGINVHNYAGRSQGKTESKCGGVPGTGATTSGIGFTIGPGRNKPYLFGSQPKGAGKDMSGKALLMVSHALPASKMAWWMSSGQEWGDSTPGAVCHAGEDNPRQFIGTRDTEGTKKETQLMGCMSFGNNLAAYYGLYYYRECDKDPNNWYHRSNGRIVRMRYPNPAYGIRDKKVYVLETPSTFSAEGDQTLGGAGGFVFPHFVPKQTAWNALAIVKNEQVKCELGAWAGTEDKNGVDDIIRPMPSGKQNDYRFIDAWNAKLTGTKFEGRMHKRTPGKQKEQLSFGWCYPLALWLYPYDNSTSDGYTDGIAKGHTPEYQPWPKWRDNTPLSERNFGRVVFHSITRPLISVLELHPFGGEPSMRMWAFGQNPPRVTENTYKGLTSKEGSATLTGLGTAPNVPRDDAREEERTNQQEEAPRAAPVETTSTEENMAELGDDDQPGPEEAFLDERGELDNLDDSWGSEKAPTANGQLKALDDRTRWLNENRPKGDTLPPGSLQRNGKGNHHFQSLEFSPWPPNDLYVKPEHSFELEPMSRDEVDEYAKKYGSVGNLLLRATAPSRYTSVKQVFGEPLKVNGKRILDMTLDSYRDKNLPPETRDVFRKHMRRILSIYWDESGDLGSAASCAISHKKKQDGMVNGLFVCKKPAKQACHDVVYAGKGCRVLLPAVFANKKKPPTPSNVLAPDKKLVAGTSSTAFAQYNVDAIRSNMTVLEWLQTPWHYEYLPFQPVNSVFEDGETYSTGCKRCSRPFYEYEYLYAPYFLSEYGTTHWPSNLWRPVDRSDLQKAPLPFHDPKFWTKLPQLAKATKLPKHAINDKGQVLKDGKWYTASGQLVQPQPPIGGYHNWITKGFMLGYKDAQNPTKTANKQSNANVRETAPLQDEWIKRVGTGSKEKVRERLIKQRDLGHFTFREYLNHAYAEGRQSVLVQGVVRSNAVKVVYGMQDYRLMRSVKYGNCCRDCMHTLDLAPGLYRRTGKVTSHLTLLKTGKVIGGRGLDTWWLPLKGTELADGTEFDPWFIYTQTQGNLKARLRDGPITQGAARDAMAEALGLSGTEYEDRRQQISNAKSKREAYALFFGEAELEAKLELHLRAVAAYSQKHACKNMDTMGNLVTKVIKPPEVYIQKLWDKQPKDWALREAAAMKDASEVLDKIVKWLDEQYKGNQLPLPRLNFTTKGANRALRDALQETHYQVAHMADYRREMQTAQFDADLTRDEFRDLTIGSTPHCLRIKQVVNPNYTKEDRKDVTEVLIKGDEYVRGTSMRVQYKQVDFIPGTNTDWSGDPFAQKETNRERGAISRGELYQTRTKTQSRFFITYSLHRRVNGDMEGRMVCEKMADALRTLFGNDQNLCDLVLFGMKLQDTNNDTISRKTFMPITEARKETTLFYGNSTGSSYLYDTYQSHVEQVQVDAGVEIGPTLHHPRFHLLLTIDHWSYIQIDTFRMKVVLEQMFKGTHRKYGKTFELLGSDGLPFYTDNENPYVDIRLYPTDNWKDVISGYMRKGAVKDSMMAIRTRNGLV